LLNLPPAEGELVVSSLAISNAYFKYDSSAFSVASDGLITFKTGDIYERKEDGHFAWMGRRHDYIQVIIVLC
jgi:acyl-coenzyme A synthetase/AMP-(fatty) acid ligase